MSSPEAENLFLRGNALLAAGRCEEALACYQEALRLRPEHPETLANLGVACAELGRVAEALTWYDAALRTRSEYPEAHYNRGNALREAKRFVEALAAYDAALKVNPSFAEAWNNRGLALMRLGRATDALQFIRYAPIVKKLGGRVVLECPERLHPLLKSCADLDGLITSEASDTGCDCQIPLLSLPGLFGADFRLIPATARYLTAEPARVKRWRRKLPKGRRLIGICWH